MTKIVNAADEQYLRETTYRRDGTPVSTPIWPVAWGDRQIAFLCPIQSGKVKRLRNNPRIALQASDIDGALLPDSEPIEGTAELVGGDTMDDVLKLVVKKYGQADWDAACDLARVLHMGKVGEYKGEIAVIITPD